METTNTNFNEEFVKALITFFPAEAAYYYSLHDMYMHSINELSDVIKEYCDSTIGEDETMKIFKLGLAAKDCRKSSSESESGQDCFIIYGGKIIISNYKNIFADSLDVIGTDIIITEAIDWFINNRICYMADDDAFVFFDIFKLEAISSILKAIPLILNKSVASLIISFLISMETQNLFYSFHYSRKNVHTHTLI